MDAVSEPAARSTLGATPLLHVLISLVARKASGSLVIDASEGQRVVFVLLGGTPQKLSVTEPIGRLSELLVHFGCIDAQVAEETFAIAQGMQSLHGQILLSRRVVDDDTLELALRAQVAVKLSWAAALSFHSTVDFYESVDFLDSLPYGPRFNSPLEVVWATARNHVDLKSVAAVLRQLVNRPLLLHPLSQPEWFGFDTNEWSVIEHLMMGAPDMQTLIQRSNVPVRIVQIMLYVLTITRQLDLGQRKTPIGYWSNHSGERPSVKLPSSNSMPALKAEESSHKSSKREAFTVPPQPRERQRAERALDALHALRKAESLLDHQRLDEAEAEAKFALESDPSQPECRALCAWIQVCKLGGAADMPKMLAILSDALEKNPVSESIRFRRAQLLSRLGQTDEAQREYRLIVELNPNHVDAMREIKLWELRNRNKRTSVSGQYTATLSPRVSQLPQQPGLFGRIFRK